MTLNTDVDGSASSSKYLAIIHRSYVQTIWGRHASATSSPREKRERFWRAPPERAVPRRPGRLRLSPST